jgi:hypothetical protein
VITQLVLNLFFPLHLTVRTIGRVERLSLPDLGLGPLMAKADTGAYTSSLHCESVQESERDGFRVLLVRFKGDKQSRIFVQFTTKKVKSSNGQSQKRYSIITQVKLGNDEFQTEFTLTDRKSMRFPALMGRKLLAGRYKIDVSKRKTLG